jgi:hypothetical protein
MPMPSPAPPPRPPRVADLPTCWQTPGDSPETVAQTLTHELRTLLEPVVEPLEPWAVLAQATPRGRPRILPSLALWAGLLVCVSQGFSSQLALRRLLRIKGLISPWSQVQILPPLPSRLPVYSPGACFFIRAGRRRALAVRVRRHLGCRRLDEVMRIEGMLPRTRRHLRRGRLDDVMRIEGMLAGAWRHLRCRHLVELRRRCGRHRLGLWLWRLFALPGGLSHGSFPF